jgi:hypothetical protein
MSFTLQGRWLKHARPRRLRGSKHGPPCATSTAGCPTWPAVHFDSGTPACPVAVRGTRFRLRDHAAIQGARLQGGRDQRSRARVLHGQGLVEDLEGAVQLGDVGLLEAGLASGGCGDRRQRGHRGARASGQMLLTEKLCRPGRRTPARFACRSLPSIHEHFIRQRLLHPFI